MSKERRSDFVLRATDEIRGTLNAAAALTRARMLVDEVDRICDAFAKHPPASNYTHWREFPVDIISYFAVGYVTCLEWHARARLVDVFKFAPACINESDLQRAGGVKSIMPLVAANASIPQYLAATRNFTQANAYIEVFEKLFGVFSSPIRVKSLIHAIELPSPLDGSVGLSLLDELFAFRNILVHEISESHIGHPFFHNCWTFEEAKQFGSFTVALIMAIEKAISSAAPHDFPHLLDENGEEPDEDEKLDQDICMLEQKIGATIDGFVETSHASKNARDAEQELLGYSGLRLRWYDGTAAPNREARRGRLRYLQTLMNEISESTISEPPQEF